MNYFIEGLQGSGKSTLVQKLSEKKSGYVTVREGDYSPVELAWCAYVDKDIYENIINKYSEISDLIKEKTYSEDDKKIICYTQIMTDIPGFHKDLEQYEIYNGRREFDEFKSIILSRYNAWNSDNMIFECSLFQNTIEDMILYRCASDEEIINLYMEIRDVLSDKEFKILYLKADDLKGNLDVIRKERSDENGNELWFPLMMNYFNESPYAKSKGVSGEEELINHFKHRQELELKICNELFADKVIILESKKYGDAYDCISNVIRS